MDNMQRRIKNIISIDIPPSLLIKSYKLIYRKKFKVTKI